MTVLNSRMPNCIDPNMSRILALTPMQLDRLSRMRCDMRGPYAVLIEGQCARQFSSAPLPSSIHNAVTFALDLVTKKASW